MSQLLARHCNTDTLPVMQAISRLLEANVSLFSPIAQTDAQGLNTTASYILVVELPALPAWRGVMPSIVPLLQTLFAYINVAGRVARTQPEPNAVLLAGQAYSMAGTILYEAFRQLHPTADHALFFEALMKERGVL